MIGVAYRPPNGNKVQSLAELNSLMTKLPHSNVYLTGDFNIDLLGNSAIDYMLNMSFIKDIMDYAML